MKKNGKTHFFISKLSKILLVENTEVLKKIWVLTLRRYVVKVIWVVALTLGFAALDGYSISLMRPILDVGFIQHNLSLLKLIALEIAGLFVLKAIVLFYSNTFLNSISLQVTNKLRSLLFAKAMILDASFFENNNTGILLTRVIDDSRAAGDLLRTIFITFFMQLATAVAMLVVMIYMSPILAITTLLGLPFAYLLIKLLNNKLRSIYHSAMQGVEVLHAFLIQIFHNIPILKIYTKETYEIQHSQKVFQRLYALQKKTFALQSSAKPIIEVFTGVVIAVAMYLGGYLISKHVITLGSFVVFFTALIALYRPLKQLSSIIPTIQTNLISVERFFMTYEAVPLVLDAPNAVELPLQRESTIMFKNVTFSYPNSAKNVLKNLSFTAKLGQTVALVGPSGSGKSTIFKLICRFYDTTSGEITLNNHDIAGITQQSLRKHIAMVTQDTYLFDSTIKENIAYGAQGAPADVSIDRVIAAAKQADAHDFIMELEAGYNTVIGERGVKLSGGQKQRVSIARAILKNAPILLLDEATSALDTQSERAVQTALNHLMKDRTTIVIAHRLSTVINADVILVLKDGEIKEEGNHKTLLEKYPNGLYAQLYQSQFENV